MNTRRDHRPPPDDRAHDPRGYDLFGQLRREQADPAADAPSANQPTFSSESST